MNDDLQELIQVFQDARLLLARPGNDFGWSNWKGPDEALAEIDGLIAELTAGHIPDRLIMQVVFAPTGSMQDTSLSSGWGDEFLKVAARFDAAIEKLPPQS